MKTKNCNFVSRKVSSKNRVVRFRLISPTFRLKGSLLSFTLNSEAVTATSRGVLERFSLWPIAKDKLTEQSGEPIKTRSEYMQTLQNAGKPVRASHDWFYLRLDDKLVRDIFSQLCNVCKTGIKQRKITSIGSTL